MCNVLPSFSESLVWQASGGARVGEGSANTQTWEFLSKLICWLVPCFEDRGPGERQDGLGAFLPAAGSHTHVLEPGKQF